MTGISISICIKLSYTERCSTFMSTLEIKARDMSIWGQLLSTVKADKLHFVPRAVAEFYRTKDNIKLTLKADDGTANSELKRYYILLD